MKPICIYHGNCADGFGAATIIHKVFGGDIDFHPGFYGKEAPDVAGRDVIIVDFSYKRDVMMEIISKARKVLVLDHHKSAESELAGLQSTSEDVEVYFDMNRSGAQMAWDYFYPELPTPKLIQHIQDRDLWRFKLPGTREIQAALFSYEYDFNIWLEMLDSDELVQTLFNDGVAIERKHFKDIAEMLKVSQREMTIGGVTVPAANLPYTYASDAGNIMSRELNTFAATYYDTANSRSFSLRSAENGMDVSEIASQYGGGGHKHAAGFRVPLSELTEKNLL